MNLLKKYSEYGSKTSFKSIKEINKVKIPKIFENEDYLLQSLLKLKND